MDRGFATVIPLVLALFGGLLYFGNSEVRRFENAAARDIKERLAGDRKTVSVRTEWSGLVSGALGDLNRATIRASDFSAAGLPLFTEPNLSQKGILRELQIELRNFSLAGLQIRSLSARIPDCRFDYALALSKKKVRLSRSGFGTGSVTVGEKELGDYIVKKYKEIKSCRVRLHGGKVFVDGYGEFLMIKGPFSLNASLDIVGQSQLLLSNAEISFDGIAADEAAVQVLLATLNPVVDLNRDLHLHGAIRIERVDLSAGLLTASGKTTIPINPALSGESPHFSFVVAPSELVPSYVITRVRS